MDKQNNTDSLLPPKGTRKVLWQVADTLEYDLLKNNAKANRHNQTEAESVFWQIARGSGLGEKCRRQYIIGEYIVDFFFRKSMLIVELDGDYHRPTPQALFAGGEEPRWFNDPKQIERDKQRQDWLEDQGYTMLRFTNEQVLFDTDSVITKIKQHLQFPINEG